MYFTTIENSSWVFFYKICWAGSGSAWIRIHSGSAFILDPDPHSEKLLDPDPPKMNALIVLDCFSVWQGPPLCWVQSCWVNPAQLPGLLLVNPEHLFLLTIPLSLQSSAPFYQMHGRLGRGHISGIACYGCIFFSASRSHKRHIRENKIVELPIDSLFILTSVRARPQVWAAFWTR